MVSLSPMWIARNVVPNDSLVNVPLYCGQHIGVLRDTVVKVCLKYTVGGMPGISLFGECPDARTCILCILFGRGFSSRPYAAMLDSESFGGSLG